MENAHPCRCRVCGSDPRCLSARLFLADICTANDATSVLAAAFELSAARSGCFAFAALPTPSSNAHVDAILAQCNLPTDFETLKSARKGRRGISVIKMPLSEGSQA